MFRSKIIHKVFQLLLLILAFCSASAQISDSRVDSIMHHYSIPALGYAVVTADSLLVMKLYGQTRLNTGHPIQPESRFHIGSNTKAVTSLIALEMVNKGSLRWESSLYEFFPEFKKITGGRKMVLSDLLNFKTPLAPFSYNTPVPDEISKGTGFKQRYRLVTYLLKQEPVAATDKLYLTNTGYILAGLMLEKASGLSYKTLVSNLGKKLQVDFQTGSPDRADSNQTSGHDEKVNPLTTENIKLEWLLSSGNINVSLPGYARFIQHFLIALRGQSLLYTKEDITYLLLSNPGFSFGWFSTNDGKERDVVVQNFGNANGFMSSASIIPKQGVAYVVLCNLSSPAAQEAVQLIAGELRKSFPVDKTDHAEQ